MSAYRPYFVAGKVAALTGGLLRRADIERLARADSAAEVGRMLAEFGWSDAPVEQMAERRVIEACHLVRKISPDRAQTDCFLLKYDVLNLKLLSKAKVLGVKKTHLSPCGTIEPELLRHAVARGRYDRLPEPLREAMEDIERGIAAEADPLHIDATLDQAMYRMIFDTLRGRRRGAVWAYFSEDAELVNLMIALRSRAMERGGAFAEGLFVPGGALPAGALIRVADGHEAPERLTKGKPYARALLPSLGALSEGGALSAVEQSIDDYLLSRLKRHRYELNGTLPLIGYLIACEREAASVRLILAGVATGSPQEILIERLRETYV